MTIHTSTPTTQNFLDMAILQIAAESYLHQWDQLGGNNDDLFEILNAGSNNLEHINRDDRSSWNGPTGLTRTQFDYFMANYEIVTHYPNDNSGFSATVFRDKRNNELTISFRSTEFKLDSAGGNWSMDGAPGADGNIGSYGFALAQLASMENFYSKLREGQECLIVQGSDGKPTVAWSYNPTLESLVSSQQAIGVTGFSLGSHLATSFAILHQEARVYNYNSAGVGSINGAAPNAGNLGEVISFYNALMAWDGQRSTIPSSPLFVDLTALYDQINDETPDNLSAIIPMRRLVDCASNTTPYGEKYQAILDLMKDSTLSSSGNGSVIGGTISIGIVQQMEALSRYISGGGDPRELTFDHGEVYGWSDRITQVFGHGLFFDPQNVANSGYHATPYFQFGVPIEDLPMSRAYGFLSMVPGTTGELLRQLIGDFGETHSIIPIVDSMTIISLFEKIDPTFGMDLFSTILTSVSNRIEEIPISSPIQHLPSFYANYQIDPDRLFDSDAIEIIINTLAEIVLGGGFTPVSGDYSNAEGFQDRDFRDRLHELASGIKNRLETASSPDRTVISFVGKSAAEISQLARTDIGVLYALLKGNAFAIVGEGARSMHEVFNENGFLDHQKYSDQYLFDRANALHWKLRYQSGAVDDDDAQLRNLSVVGQAFTIQPNLGDKQFDSEWDSSDVIGDWDYSISDFGQSDRDNDGQNDDIAFSIDGSVERMGDYLTTTINHRIAFGNNDAESMTGGNNGDRLYGEGGNDQLDGGKGDDRLEGGDGFDVYIVGEGIDRILDRDRSGMILWRDPEYPMNYRILGINGVSDAENNWIELGPNTYWDRQNNVKYILSNDITTGKTALYIFSSGRTDGKGIAIIEDYQSGDFGIVLQPESPVSLPTVTMNNDLVGSIQHDDPLTNVTNRDLRYDGLGGNDLLSGSVGNDRLAGGDGDDVLIGSMGADRMAGGDGNDFIGDDLHNIAIGAEDLSQITPAPAGATLVSSGKGWELWIGPDGAVILRYQSINPDTAPIPENNNDYASGGNGDDLIFMNWGDDAVDGGAGMDYIEGGHDSDMLDGGADDDIIFGDEGARTGYYLDPALAARFRIDGNDRISGGGGNDQIVGNGGQDYIDGGDDNDLIFGDNGREIEVNPNYDLSLEVSGKDMIDGGNGNDEIHGGGDDDHIDGGDGDDRIYGDNAQVAVGLSMYRQYDGDDVIDGGRGNDLVVGMGGDDAIAGGQGDDTLIGDHTSQIAELVAGNDTIFGEDGNDGIRGNAGNDYLDGGNGNDAIYGDDGNDILRGGAGSDLMDGGTGDDIYVIDANWGNDLIRGMNTGSDIVRFAAGINPTSLNVSIDWSTGRLLIQDPATGSVLGIEGYFEDSSAGRRIEFANGTAWTVSDVVSRFRDGSGTMAGTAGNDTYVGGSGADSINGNIGNDILLGGSGNDSILGGMHDGYSGTATDHDALFGGDGDDTIDGQRGDDQIHGDGGNDTLDGGAGNDTLIGGAGSDTLNGGEGANTYYFEPGFGHDRIMMSDQQYYHEYSAIQFGGGISAAMINARISGRDLIIEAGQDSITIANFTTRRYARFAIVFSDGSTLPPHLSELITAYVGTANGDDLTGTPYDDTLRGYAGHDVIKGNGGADRIAGGTGNDLLQGDLGSDTYEYGLGDGGDTIVEAVDNGTDMDTLSFAAGILPGDLNLYRDGNDLVVVVGNSNQQIRVEGQFLPSGAKRIERIAFVDSPQTIWDAGTISSLVVTGTQNSFTGTSGNDTFVVDHSGDTIVEAAGGGVDTVLSSASYRLPDNVENITLTGVLNINATGNRLDNVLRGNSGNNILRGCFDDGTGGEYGNDTAYGGHGDDSYYDVDTIVEYANEGYDTKYTTLTTDTLQDNLERLVVTGSWYQSGSTPNQYTGNALDNVLDVTSVQWSVLDGGAGADRMVWRGGNSDLMLPRTVTFVIDNVGDTWEVLAEGYRIELRSSLGGVYHWDSRISSYESTSTGVIEIHGDGTANTISTFTAAAGSLLNGGAGDDTYIIGAGSAAYVIQESAGGGIDTIDWRGLPGGSTPSTADISGIANIERIYLDESSLASNATGNNGDNSIYGNIHANIIDGRGGDDYMSGGRGDDTYYVDSTGDVVVEANNSNWNDTQGYDTIYSSVDYEMGTGIEKLQLVGGAITATGNSLGNHIIGNALDNIIDGGTGGYGDRLEGGGGNDTLLFGNSYSPILDGGDGSDTYVASISGQLFAEIIEERNVAGQTDTLRIGSGVLPQDVTVKAIDGRIQVQFGDNRIYINMDSGTGKSVVERIVFDNGTIWNVDDVVISNPPPTSSGNFSEIALRGRTFQFVIPPNAFVDTPDDTLSYGAELPSWLSFDPVTRTISGTVPSTATGTVVIPLYASDTWGQTATSQLTLNLYQPREGTSGADSLTGTSAADAIYGYAGNDTLNGSTGADLLVGGTGDDSYVVDNTGDIVKELANEGNDLVTSSISYTLGDNLERLTLSGTGNLTGTGNSLNNTLSGNNGNNTLNGGAGDDTLNGGGGTDTLIGGTGNDIYEVDTTTDVITELSGEGNDTIKSSVTFDMTNRANIENLTLTGSNAINGTGNSLDNVLTGNGVNNTLNGGDGNDTLNGAGGTDTMLGGRGDDIYYVDVSTDVVTENSGEGIDTVYSAVTFDISTGTRTNLENVTLTGSGAINAIGNGNANVLIGGSGNNSLTGNGGSDTLEGGAGTDSLSGGTGNDTYQMARGYGTDTAIENDTTAGNYDIAKFLSGVAYDQLWFSRPSGSNNLEITIIGTTDKLVVKDWYLGNQYRTEEIQTVDGNRYLLAADVQTLVTAMAGLTPPAQGQTTLSASQRTALNTALGAWKTRTSLMSSSLPADQQGNGQTQRRTIDGGLSDFAGGRRQYEDVVSTTRDATASYTADVDTGDTRVAWNADRGFGHRSGERSAEWHGIVFDRAGEHRRASQQAGGAHGSTEAPTCSKPVSNAATCAKPVAMQSLEQEWRQPDAFDVMLPPLDLFMIPSTCDKTPDSTLCGLPQNADAMVMSNCNRLVDLMAMASGDETAIGLLPQHDVARAEHWTP